MVEDRIGRKTFRTNPLWLEDPFLVGRPIPVTLISQTPQRPPCCGKHSIRAFDRRRALHHRRPAKIVIVGERGICGFDFFSHTDSELEKLMEDHFISPAAIEQMLEDDFDGFIEEREKTITKHISSLVAANRSEAAVQ